MSQPNNTPETDVPLSNDNTSDVERSHSSQHHHSSSGHSSHHSSESERHHSSHSSSGSSHSSRSSSDSSSGSGHSSHGSSGSSHSSRSSSGSSSGSGRSSHGSSGSSHSSSHRLSSHSSRYDAEREHREALIGKYQVVSQDDIPSETAHVHHHRHHRRHGRRRTIRRILIAVASVVLSLILIAGGTFAVLHRIGKQQVLAEPAGIRENPYSVTYDEGSTVEYDGGVYELNRSLVTIAAIGVDRTDFGLEDDKIGTAGQADMILLLALDLDTGLVRGILIPRDTMVDVDLYTVDGQYVGVDNMQICLSFAYGDGGQTSAKNVLTSVGRVLYDIPLTLFGAMDLDGIAALNDAIGGVTVTLESDYNGAAAGQQITLHGMDAQTFVRARDTESLNSDAERRVRQMQYLRAFIDKAYSAVRQDIGVIRRLYNVAMQYAFTNVSLAKVTYLATTLLSKGAVVGDIITLQGEMQDADPYPEYHLDEKAAFETVLDVFYTRVN